MKLARYCICFALIASLVPISSPTAASAAAIPTNDFSLEVSPSPLVATVKPGTATILELKIRNASLKPEDLKIETRNFRIAYPDQNIVIGTTTPPDLEQWVKYENPTFRVEPGEWFTQKITVKLPEQAGFSSPFVVVVSRANDAAVTSGGRLIKGSVGVFTLINVDKPGAKSEISVVDFKPEKSFYEYLPADLKLTLRNTGNSIVQPYGNVYIQRSSNDQSPISVLPVNDTRSYILPGVTKEITASWNDGFPHYVSKNEGNEGKPVRVLEWNWQNAGKFRFGKYTAKIVAVYNDGSRDVPITGEVSFWVIPWRLLLGALVVLLIFGFGLWSAFKSISTSIKGPKRQSKPPLT